MKKISSILLIIVLMLSLFSCSDKYYQEEKPQGKEDETVLTTEMGDVKFDLFRALYITSISGGYSHENAVEKALYEAVRIYAVFSICNDAGIKYDSRDMLDRTDETVTLAVNGGGDYNYTGYGTFEDYLTAIKELGFTDRANRLTIRAYICEEELFTYYLKDENEPKEQDVKDFFLSDDCIHVVWLENDYESVAVSAKSELDTKQTEKDKITAIIKYTPGANGDYYNGWYIGKNYGGDDFSLVTDAAFALEVGEYSKIVKDKDGVSYIVLRMEKDASYINNNYDAVCDLYVNDSLNKKINDKTNEMLKNAKKTDFLYSLINNPSEITNG